MSSLVSLTVIYFVGIVQFKKPAVSKPEVCRHGTCVSVQRLHKSVKYGELQECEVEKM